MRFSRIFRELYFSTKHINTAFGYRCIWLYTNLMHPKSYTYMDFVLKNIGLVSHSHLFRTLRILLFVTNYLIFIRSRFLFFSSIDLHRRFFEDIAHANDSYFLSKWIPGMFSNWRSFYRIVMKQTATRLMSNPKAIKPATVHGLRRVPDFVYFPFSDSDFHQVKEINSLGSLSLSVTGFVGSASPSPFILFCDLQSSYYLRIITILFSLILRKGVKYRIYTMTSHLRSMFKRYRLVGVRDTERFLRRRQLIGKTNRKKKHVFRRRALSHNNIRASKHKTQFRKFVN